MNLPGRASLVVVLWALVPVALAAADQAAPDPVAVEFFEKKVRPVLAEHCFKCHSTQAKKPKGGLLLDSRAALLKGGDSGPALLPGQADRGRFVEAVTYKNIDLRMPPKAKLPDAAIDDLTTWVKMGAPWPHEGGPAAVTKAAFDLRKRKREHWAWQPVRAGDPPAVKNGAWPRSPVDPFILAQLEARGLAPAPAADRRTLLRRLSFDLIGLPPTPEEMDAFLSDPSGDALEKVVDRLLTSPHFGERWGRHWLDLVRYAETRGHEFDYIHPNAYQYRDYVIRALNVDLPYNQFVTEHLAGDLLDQPRLHPVEGFNESILGTGFWFLGEEVHSPVDPRQDETDRFDNRVDVMGKTFLGLTVACARCHDHKFDAISTRDYYALFGFLQSSGYRLARFDSMEHNRRVARDLLQLREQARPQIQRALAASLRPGVERLAEYLLAAREVILQRATASGAGGKPDGPDGWLEEVARQRRLDPPAIARWVDQLAVAGKDPQDPFHAWALVSVDPAAKDPKRLAALVKPLAEGGRRRDAEAALSGAEVVIDYGKAGPEAWMQDGVAFGPAPVRPGDVRFGSDPARPIARVFDHAAAEKDPTWDVLKPAPGAENDPAPVGSLVRSGRTLRTPTFRISTGTVFYLVKGHGSAYAAVDSHVMISGPLHGQLVLPLRAGHGFQWIAQDLGTYKGHRTHVEFTPADGSDFAVAMVVQAAIVPGSPERSNQALLRLLAGSDSGSLEALAAGYQRLLLDVLGRLGSDRIRDTADAADTARLADWMVQRPELFAAGDRTRLAQAAAPFLAEQAKLVGQIQARSRLALAMLDGDGQDENVLIRGSSKNPGPPVPRRFLEALAGAEPLAASRGSGRLELARQITDPSLNPLIARVLVNRVWHHLFGRGLVASVDNFGVLGDRPTHPELLDFLADRFVRQGWSIKTLMRSLVLSSTYQMSSQPDARADQADPQDLLLHRMRLRRLEGEVIRDALLTVSGRLRPQLYGPPVPVYLTEFMEGRGRPQGGPLDGDGRRSVYLAVRRNFLSPLLLAFDTPIPFSTVGRRTVSNVPAQALILLNDPLVHQQADRWARRVLAQPDDCARKRIAGMYQSAFGRPPTAGEAASCRDFLNRQAKLYGKADDPAAWADLAHALFNVKEFIFLN
jgi:hypothetical protein